MWENTSGATIIIGDVFWDIDKGLKVLIVNSSALTTRPRLVSQPRTMFESGGVRFPLVTPWCLAYGHFLHGILLVEMVRALPSNLRTPCITSSAVCMPLTLFMCP